MAQSSFAPLALSESMAPSVAPASREPVDVNTASADLLRKCVPKVGAVLAQRIVDFREQNGPFKSVDELMHVPGIGRRLAESLIPPAADSSMVLAIRHGTLPPPWGTPDLSSPPEGAPKAEEREEAHVANDSAPAAKSASAPVAAPARSKSSALKVAALAVAVVAGLCIGVYANTQSVKRPTRELSERIDVNRTENDRTRAELDQHHNELKETQEAVKALASRVDTESAERKADHARISHDVTTLHDTVKRTNQSNEARVQRLRETLTEIELYHGANIAHPTGTAHAH